MLRIEALNGVVYKSEPVKMEATSAIDSIYYVWEEFLPIKGQTRNGFRIFLNSKLESKDSKYVRWRFTGTYMVESIPSAHLGLVGTTFGPDPLPCSGFEYTGSFLKKFGPCECCFCWVNDYEDKPKLNDDVIGTGDHFRNVEVGYVPFDKWTFAYNRYMVKLEQMSLSRQAYDFWKTIRDQKEGATSLFQPAFGRLPTNIYSSNSEKVFGLFYTSSVTKKVMFLTDADAPINIVPAEIGGPFFWDACDKVYINAFRTPPPEWE